MPSKRGPGEPPDFTAPSNPKQGASGNRVPHPPTRPPNAGLFEIISPMITSVLFMGARDIADATGHEESATLFLLIHSLCGTKAGSRRQRAARFFATLLVLVLRHLLLIHLQ
jgi:hypothetical protein